MDDHRLMFLARRAADALRAEIDAELGPNAAQVRCVTRHEHTDRQAKANGVRLSGVTLSLDVARMANRIGSAGT